MHDQARTTAAHLLRGYRRHMHAARASAARQTGILAELERASAERYRMLALGAREMFHTLYPK